MKNDNNNTQLKKGQNFILDLDPSPGDQKRVNFPHPQIYDILTPNSEVLIDDGRIKLQIIDQNNDSLTTEVLNDGMISNNKGINSLNSLDGMFSFLIWDGISAWIARDRFGEKPLYYSKLEEGIYVSSELEPLIKILRIKKIKNTKIVNSFLSLGAE